MTAQISPPIPAHFEQSYQRLLNCLKLAGMQPKTIALYSHGVRRAGAYFDYRIDALSKPQLTDYFVHIIDTLSWSSLKHDLYGLKFYYAKVLDKPWPGADLVKPPKSFALPDIITVSGAADFYGHKGVELPGIFLHSDSLGLRLQVGDIDADRNARVQFVMPKAIATVLCRCRRTPCRCCAVSGKPTATRRRPFPTGMADSRIRTWRRTRWIAAAFRPLYAKSLGIVV